MSFLKQFSDCTSASTVGKLLDPTLLHTRNIAICAILYFSQTVEAILKLILAILTSIAIFRAYRIAIRPLPMKELLVILARDRIVFVSL
jgi:hypothetical protein